MEWVSLHHHTTFSTGDGFGTVEEHVQRAIDLGMKAISTTEHGNVSSHVQLEKACAALGSRTAGARASGGIKPIFGCELYIAPTDPDSVGPDGERGWNTVSGQLKWHQTVLAMNEVGYQNLNRIVSASWRDNHNYWPTTSMAMLKRWNEGLIVLSGCSDSMLACALLGGKTNGPKRLEASEIDWARARRVAGWFNGVFPERYYLEVQRFPGLERVRALNPLLARLGEELGIPLVATADVHYPHPEDNEMQKILHASHRGSTVDAVEASWEYDILLTLPTSDEEITQDIVDTGLAPGVARFAVEMAGRIADRCNVVLPKNEPIKWPYDTNKFDNIEAYIWEKLREGWRFRWPRNGPMRANAAKYGERLEYEMERIIPRGFCDYFAVLSYLVSWAKDQKIAVGPARGSAAASLVCYMLRITEIDPLQHPLMMFERFIDPKRLDLPDVDLDFEDTRRWEVIEEARRVFGSDHVSNIANFTRYRGKNSLDDVARVYRIPPWATDKIKERIIERSGGDSRISDSLEDTFNMFSAAMHVLKDYPELALAMRLEGNYRSFSVHAAGIVISNNPITDTCAVYERKGKPAVIAYDKKDAEYLGMLKADFLSLKTMGAIGLILSNIGMDLEDLYSVPIDEPETLAAFKANDVTGIFQFDGRATRLVCHDVSPDNFDQLADINALSRPGPLFSGMTAKYCDAKHGRAEPAKLHPIVDAITETTYGQVVYQEQVLNVVRDLGGFPVKRVGDIRKIISQKLGEAQFNTMAEEFRDGAERLHGVKPELSAQIWKYLVTSATYSFNTAHSVSYAKLAFWLMWLKVHYPVEFYAAQLTKIGDAKTVLVRRERLMRDAMRHGVTVRGPNILVSNENWTAYRGGSPGGGESTGTVVAGFRQMKGVGEITAKKIMAIRDSVAAWDDLIRVDGIGPKTIAAMKAFSSAEDPFGLRRTAERLAIARADVERAAFADAGRGGRWDGGGGGDGGDPTIWLPTHRSHEIPREGEHIIVWMGMVRSKEYKDYVEDQRARTGDSVEEIRLRMKDPHLEKSCVMHCYDDGDEEVYIRFNRWVFPDYKEDIENIQLDSDVIVVIGKKREDFGISLHVQPRWKVEDSVMVISFAEDIDFGEASPEEETE